MHIPIILDFIGFDLLLQFAHLVGIINKWAIAAIITAINIGGLISLVCGAWELIRLCHRKATGKPCD